MAYNEGEIMAVEVWMFSSNCCNCRNLIRAEYPVGSYCKCQWKVYYIFYLHIGIFTV